MTQGPVRIAVTGAGGRMGRAIIAATLEEAGVALAAAIERPGSPAVGADAGTLAGASPCGVTVGTDLASAAREADVLIEFAAPGSAVAVAEIARETGRAAVIGTTGLDDAQRDRVRAAASHAPIVFAANMSVGVTLLLSLVQQAVETLGSAFDVEIVELHHRLKKDSPSGTALALAGAAAETLGRPLTELARHGRVGVVGPRPASEMGIHAVRGGDVVGDHTVYFFGDGERIELTHRASGRATFAHGAVRAAKWLSGRAPGLYDMRDVLALRRPDRG